MSYEIKCLILHSKQACISKISFMSCKSRKKQGGPVCSSKSMRQGGGISVKLKGKPKGNGSKDKGSKSKSK